MKPFKDKQFNKHRLLSNWTWAILLLIGLFSFAGFSIQSINQQKAQDICVAKPIAVKNRKALNYKTAVYLIEKQMNWSSYLFHTARFTLQRHNRLAKQGKCLSQLIFNQLDHPHYHQFKIISERAIDTPFSA